jgi:hypothetical protein
MPRIVPLWAAVALGLATLPAAAQQLLQPQPGAAATPPSALPPSPNDRPPSTLPSDPGQRPASTSPVPSEGPAKLLPPTPPQPSREPGAVSPPAGVFDASGRPINDMLRVGPNRALDPRTGRFYQTTPAGKLIEPPPLPPPPTDR